MLLLLELADLIISLLIYLLLSGNDSFIFKRAVAFHSIEAVSGADHAIGEHKLAGRVLSLVVRGVLVIGEIVQKVKLLLSCIERVALVLSLLQDLSDDLSRNLFVLLDLFEVDGAILGWDVYDTELSLVASLRQLPLLVSFKIIREGLLLHCLEGLEFNNLSEHVLVRLSLEEATILSIRGELLVAFSQVQQSISGILGEL